MDEYTRGVLVTENTDYIGISERLHHTDTIRLLHAAMGLATESGELLDALKKHIFYGKKLDLVNVREELGDIFWYAALLAHAGGFTLEDTMERNLAKLKARYPSKFSEVDAIIRNLEKERDILETVTSDCHKPEPPSPTLPPEPKGVAAREILSQFDIRPGRKSG